MNIASFIFYFTTLALATHSSHPSSHTLLENDCIPLPRPRRDVPSASNFVCSPNKDEKCQCDYQEEFRAIHRSLLRQWTTRSSIKWWGTTGNFHPIIFSMVIYIIVHKYKSSLWLKILHRCFGCFAWSSGAIAVCDSLCQPKWFWLCQSLPCQLDWFDAG